MSRKMVALIIVLVLMSGALVTTSVYLMCRQMDLARQIETLMKGNRTEYEVILTQYMSQVDTTVSQVGQVVNVSGMYDYRTPFLQVYNATVYFEPNDTGPELQTHNGVPTLVYGAWMLKLDELCIQNKLAMQTLVRVDNFTYQAVFETAYYYGKDVVT